MTFAQLPELVRAGRARDAAALPAVQALAASPDPHLRAYAAWAAWRIAREAPSRRAWHVDAASGDDGAAGGRDRPLRSIAEAVRRARPGDTVAIHPGDYREMIEPWIGGANPGAPLTFEATGPGVRILAHDPWEPLWRDEGDGRWSAGYERLPWDDAPRETPEARCEQVWCDGELLTHRAAIDDLAKGPGFATAGERLWLRVDGRPHGRISRSRRMHGLRPLVRGLGPIVLRGLAFAGGAAHVWTGGSWHSIGQDAVVAVRAGHDWLIEDCDIGWGNAQGIELGWGGFADILLRLPVVSTPENYLVGDGHHNWHHEDCGRHVVRRCRVHHHGIAGIVGIGGTDHLRITGCDVERNARKDHSKTCEDAGIKLHSCRDCLIDGNRVRWNDSFGIWLDAACRRNRVTGNLLVGNANHQLFHEISEGPALFDANIVVDERGADAGTGFYTHDGNFATVANNAFIGCATGVRVRALFHRKLHDGYTTTCDNRILCNLFVGNREAISLMPEKPRNERNRSDGNIFWNSGAPPRLKQENTGDVGVRWEDTAYGRLAGVRGGGDAFTDLPLWQQAFGLDAGSVVLPASLCGPADPEALLARLVEARDRLGLDVGAPPGWAMALPDAAGWLALLAPQARLGRHRWTVQTGPAAGLACWDGADGPRFVRWSGDRAEILAAAPDPALLLPRLPDADAAAIVAGDRRELPLGSARLVAADPGLAASAVGGRLVLCPAIAAAQGGYTVIVAEPGGWRALPMRLAPAQELIAIAGDPAPEGNAVTVTLHNHAAAPAEVVVAVTAGATANATATLPPRSQGRVRVPIAAADAALAKVRVRTPGGELAADRLVAWAIAGRGAAWGTEHDLNAFPDGSFPDGAWAFVLYKGTLKARWRARWDDAALHVEVIAEHAHHMQVRSDPHGWHTGSAAFISVRPGSGGGGTEVGLAMRSDTGEKLCGFRKSVDTSRYPIEACGVLPFSIERSGTTTRYAVSVPWTVMGAAGPPPAGADLPFSVMVSQHDDGMAYGLQWFYGIEYHHHENDEAWMGRLRLG